MKTLIGSITGVPRPDRCIATTVMRPFYRSQPGSTLNRDGKSDTPGRVHPRPSPVARGSVADERGSDRSVEGVGEPQDSLRPSFPCFRPDQEPETMPRKMERISFRF